MKRVFLSFTSENLEQVPGFRLLAKNPNYDLDLYDESIKIAINSTNADYIKRVISEKITRASVTLCLIGRSTHESKWIDWELEKSKESGNKIIAMGLKEIDRAVLPKLIKESGVSFHHWNPSNLSNIL